MWIVLKFPTVKSVEMLALAKHVILALNLLLRGIESVFNVIWQVV